MKKLKYKISLFFARFKIAFSSDIKAINLSFTDYNEYVEKAILSTLKLNGFVEINKKGEFYLKDFTLIELVRFEKDLLDKNNKGAIKQVLIKHDIDNIVSSKVKTISIKGKVTNLQRMINYFGKI